MKHESRLVVFIGFIFSIILLCGCQSNSEMPSSSSDDGFSPIASGGGRMHSEDFSSEYRSGVTLVYFAKPACPACAQQDPEFEALLKELPSGAKATKVYDYMVNDDRYGIKKYPTLMVFKDGKPVWDSVGVASKSSMLRAIKRQID